MFHVEILAGQGESDFLTSELNVLENLTLLLSALRFERTLTLMTSHTVI